MIFLLFTLIIADTTYILSPVYVKGKRDYLLEEKFPMTFHTSRPLFSSKTLSLLNLSGTYPRNYTNMTGLSIRGSGMEEIKVLLEGIPVKSPQNGYFDFELVPSDLIGGFETLLTGNSSYFGYDAMAGLVNIRLTNRLNFLRFGLGKNFFSIASVTGFLLSTNTFVRAGFSREITPGGYTVRSKGHVLKIKNSGRENFFGFTKFVRQKSTLFFAFSHSRRGIPIIPGGLTTTPDSIFENLVMGSFRAKILDLSFALDNFTYKPHSRPQDHHVTGRIELKLTPVKFLTLRAFWEGIRSHSLENHTRYGLSLSFNYSQKAGIFYPFVSFSGDYWFNEKSFKPSFFAGLTLSPGFYTSFSTGYRLPTFNDLYWPESVYAHGNPDLKTENLEEFELGFKRFLNFTKINISLFFRNYRDLIKWSPVDRGIWTPINLDSVKIRGLDGNVQFKIGKISLLVFGEYIDTVFSKMHLIYYPMNKIGLTLNYGMNALSIVRIGRRYERLTGPKTMPPVTLVNLHLGFSMGKNSIFLEITNLTNRSYSLIRGYPAPGRQWRVKLETKI